MQGSFLPIMAIMKISQHKNKISPNLIIDPEQGLSLLHSAVYFGKIKPVRVLVEKFKADPTISDYRG